MLPRINSMMNLLLEYNKIKMLGLSNIRKVNEKPEKPVIPENNERVTIDIDPSKIFKEKENKIKEEDKPKEENKPKEDKKE